MNKGKIVEIIGPVLDVEFTDSLPAIYNALEIDADTGSGKIHLVAEVQQHLGDNKVRAVAMDSTDGLARGMEVVDTGVAITVPVGQETLGRLFNLLGEPIDEGQPLSKDVERWPIHRPAPVRCRHSPGCSDPNSSGPMLSRIKRRTGWPKSAAMRRICRLRPSRKMMRNRVRSLITREDFNWCRRSNAIIKHDAAPPLFEIAV